MLLPHVRGHPSIRIYGVQSLKRVLQPGDRIPKCLTIRVCEGKKAHASTNTMKIYHFVALAHMNGTLSAFSGLITKRRTLFKVRVYIIYTDG